MHLLYSVPGEARAGFAELRELADRIRRPPYNWTPELIWEAYRSVEADRVRGANRRTVTDLVSLVRFSMGVEDELVPYPDRVRERYAAWLATQEQAGAAFTERQRWWLDRMADVVATSAGITADDLDDAPFTDRGGVDGALRDLGDRTGVLVVQLNDKLTA